MKTLRTVILLMLAALLVLTGCSAKKNEGDGGLTSTLPAVTVPAVTVPAATVAPTEPADNGILSTEPPAAAATATAVPAE